MVIFMREERDAAKADRAEMEEKMEAKLGQQRAEMEATVAQLTAPQEAVSAEQIGALPGWRRCTRRDYYLTTSCSLPRIASPTSSRSRVRSVS